MVSIPLNDNQIGEKPSSKKENLKPMVKIPILKEPKEDVKKP